jgi:hypothetical protein
MLVRRFTGMFDYTRGSYYVWDASNARRVGNGKGETLTLGSQAWADTIAREMSARVAALHA